MRLERPTMAALLSAALALALYGTRLCPTLALQGDSAEIVTAAAVWGVPHAPGYPAFTALGHLMTKLPFGEVAWRVHMTSALFHAAAVLVVGLLVARMTRASAPVVAACGALGLSRAFFAASLYAEVFPLNDLLFAVVLLLAREVGAASSDDRAARMLFHLAWVSGLAAAHHPMIVFGAPSVVLLAGRRLASIVRARPRAMLLVAGAAALPFALSYALVPIAAFRDPAISWGEVSDLRGLARLVLRLDYGGPFRAALHEAPPDVPRRLVHWGASMIRNATPGALVVAAVGLVLHGRRRGSGARREAVALGLAVIFPGAVFAAMNVHFQATEEERVAIAERFTTMSMVGFAAGVGLGVAAAIAWLNERVSLPRARAVCTAVVSALPLVVLAPEAYAIDLSSDRRGIAYAHDLVRPTTDDALLLTAGDLASPAVLYVCHVERACKDRIVLSPGLLGMSWYSAQVARRRPELGPLPSSVREIHRLVEAQIRVRRVYALPSVVLKDPLLVERFEVEPALLLLRVAARGAPGTPDAPDDATADALAWGSAMAADDDGRCEGCRLGGGGLFYPTMQVGVVREYATAMKNHAVVAREAGASSLALALERRAAVLARNTSLPRPRP